MQPLSLPLDPATCAVRVDIMIVIHFGGGDDAERKPVGVPHAHAAECSAPRSERLEFQTGDSAALPTGGAGGWAERQLRWMT